MDFMGRDTYCTKVIYLIALYNVKFYFRDLFIKPQISEDEIYPKKIKTIYVIWEIIFMSNVKANGLMEKSETSFVTGGNKMYKIMQIQTLLE